MILNLGAGKKIVPGAINVDITAHDGINKIMDLSHFPWEWENNSINGIYASHVMEHFLDQVKFIEECYRILKPGGFLKISVPHCTSISSLGCIGHYRTYSCNTLKNYLSGDIHIDSYMFKKTRFETVENYTNWLWEGWTTRNIILRYFIYTINFILNKLIKLSPKFFEHYWWVFVGGASEVVWKGIKL